MNTMTQRLRILSFLAVGGCATLIQLGLLALATTHGWSPVPANALALALSAQVSFGLNAGLTWHDTWTRSPAVEESLPQLLSLSGLPSLPKLLASRWARYMSAVVVTATLNELLYTGIEQLLPAVAAAALCSLAIAALNFAIGDTLVFTRNRLTQKEKGDHP